MTDGEQEAKYETLSQAGKPVVVFFNAPWAGPCKMLKPIFEALKKELGEKIEFVTVNTDVQIEVAVTYGVRSVPTLLFFKDGKQVGELVGYRPMKETRRPIDALLKGQEEPVEA